MHLLEIEKLVKRFGALTVLDGIDLHLPANSIHGVIGPNGAGKTTLFDVITGISPADGGSIRLNGAEITRKSVEGVAAMGVGRTFQVARVFNEMTVLENMLVAAHTLSLSRAEARDRALGLLETARLATLSEQLAIEISGGQKKLLEFVRTMMLDPAVVLLDEPFNGINPALIDRLIEIILQTNRERGTAFLLISHEMPHVMTLCERVFVLNAGQTIAHGTPAEVRENPLVVEAYLGH